MRESNDIPQKQRPRFRGIGIIIFVSLALAAGAAVFALRGGFTDQNDSKVIINNVKQHIVLPDEEPTITTVEKASELSVQAFFSSVKDGDKILIYPKSARIIIYRPSENILVNVGPIVDDAAASTDKDSATTDGSTDSTTTGGETTPDKK